MNSLEYLKPPQLVTLLGEWPLSHSMGARLREVLEKHQRCIKLHICNIRWELREA